MTGGMSLKLLLCTAATFAIGLAGCGPRPKPTEPICAGKTSVQESLAALQARAANVAPVKASGSATYTYHVNGKKHDESLNTLLLRFEPPGNIYVQGDKAFIPRAVLLGANDQEFWMAIRPKEVSKYLWGQWGSDSNESAQIRQCLEQFWLGPQKWLDVLGVVQSSLQDEWSLSHKGGNDVLQLRRQGILCKRITIYNCSYEVRQIQYFDANGKIAAIMDLAQYMDVQGSNGWKIPSEIKIESESKEILTVNIKTAVTTDFNTQQKTVLFSRPSTSGFEFVGKLNSDCEFAPQ